MSKQDKKSWVEIVVATWAVALLIVGGILVSATAAEAGEGGVDCGAFCMLIACNGHDGCMGEPEQVEGMCISYCNDGEISFDECSGAS